MVVLLVFIGEKSLSKLVPQLPPFSLKGATQGGYKRPFQENVNIRMTSSFTKTKA